MVSAVLSPRRHGEHRECTKDNLKLEHYYSAESCQSRCMAQGNVPPSAVCRPNTYKEVVNRLIESIHDLRSKNLKSQISDLRSKTIKKSLCRRGGRFACLTANLIYCFHHSRSHF